MFTHNLGEVLMIFSATALGWPLPLMPLQILWMNLVTDVFPALSLAMEPPSPNTMKRKPRHADSSLLSRDLIILISWQSAMLAAIALLSYWWALGVYGPGEHARTIGLFTLIGVQLGHLFNCRSQTRSAFSNLFSNPYVWVATLIVIALQLMAVFVAPLSLVLGTTKPNQVDWAVIIGAVIVPILIVEVTKLAASSRRETINL
jgi:Ca2+-transporting ATPase